MSVEHILTEILNRPLLITPEKLQVILGVLSKKTDNPISVDLSALIQAGGGDLNNGAVMARSRPVNSSSVLQIAVVGATGSLVYRNGGGEGLGSGLRSYRYMQKDIQAGLDDSEIDGQIIDFNTYGGTAQGCERMARFIRYADGIKPIYGVVDLNCFSAGYYLAAGCRKIILTDEDAGVGSIGCLAIHRDQSKKNKKEGIVYTAVYFGSQKNDLSPHEPLSPDLKKKLQRSVDKFGMKFSKSVAELRGLSLDQVLATTAGAFYGQDAIDAGLADHIIPFDEAVAMLAAEIDEQKQNSTKGLGSGFNSDPEKTETNLHGGPEMDTKERMEALLKADDGPAAIAALGYVKNDALAEAVAKAVEAEETKMSATLGVAELCQLAQLPLDQTVKMLKDGLTVAQATESIQKMRADKSKQTPITSTITQLSGDGKHPLVASCEELAGK